MTERRFDPAEDAWRLVPVTPAADPHPPARVARDDFEIAVLDDDFLASALGASEIVAYAAEPAASIGTVGAERLEALVHVWAHRYAELGGRRDVEYVYVFEDRGEEPRDVRHSHFHVHAYQEIPPRALRKLQRAQAHLEERGTCVYCDIVAAEQEQGRRLVAENESFVAFVPFAPRFAQELHVLSRRHAASLLDLTDPERVSLAELLAQMVPGYERLLGGARYLVAVHQAPTDDGRFQPVSHFQIELVPLRRGGPELGAGAFILDAAPEETAAELRALVAR